MQTFRLALHTSIVLFYEFQEDSLLKMTKINKLIDFAAQSTLFTYWIFT